MVKSMSAILLLTNKIEVNKIFAALLSCVTFTPNLYQNSNSVFQI